MRKIQDSNLIFNRKLVVPNPFSKEGERFTLADGFYFNEDQTVFIKSSNKTAKLFRVDGNK